MLQDECESSRTYAAGRGEDDRIEQIVTDVRGGGKRKGPQYLRTANVDGSSKTRFRRAVRLGLTRSQTPHYGEEDYPPEGEPGERFCQVTPNKINKNWRKCMGIEPTYRPFQTIHRI